MNMEWSKPNWKSGKDSRRLWKRSNDRASGAYSIGLRKSSDPVDSFKDENWPPIVEIYYFSA